MNLRGTRAPWCAVLVLGAFFVAVAADLPKPEPMPGHVMLPQAHQYQRVLRQYLTTLVEKDFDPGVTTPISAQPVNQDPDMLFRHFLYWRMKQPPIGSRNGASAVTAPSKLFLLSAIEGPEAIMLPPVWPETLTAFVNWDYPGNPYYNNRALKLRAFVAATLYLLLFDEHFDQHPTEGRVDFYANKLLYFGAPYTGFKDVLPPAVQQAYETGLRKQAERLIAWGPVGEEPNLDMISPVSVWYVSQALNDPAFTQQAEAYARRMLDAERFHSAGYFIDHQGIELGFGGTANFFAIWLALASDWPFAKEAVERIYRLRAHLMLPEPTGGYLGPSHFNSRLPSDASADQWGFGARDLFASLVTDEAAYLTSRPSVEEMRNAAAKKAKDFADQLNTRPIIEENEDSRQSPYLTRLFLSYSLPVSINPGSAFYPQGAYARREKLEATKSPYLKSPFLRDGAFIRDFENAFTVSKQESYSAIVHSGPVGTHGAPGCLHQATGPLGFGGGQLSAFWTPATGSVILGRRGGVTHSKNYDLPELWRQWPIHAVTGGTVDGKVFTSARIARPAVASTVEADNRRVVTVRGAIPSELPDLGKSLRGTLAYTRTFHLSADRVRVETTVQGDGKDALAELYETVPVVMARAPHPQSPRTTIAFQTGGQWHPATTEYQEHVTAVRITRLGGAVEITFDEPRRVKLAPDDWKSTYFAGPLIRNILIDLLGRQAPVPLTGSNTVRYTIRTAAP